MTNRNILLTPGPVPVPEPVLRALALPVIHHRTPQYRKVFEAATEKLHQVFLTKHPVYTITGSGTAGMEAAMVNLHSAGDEVLIVEAGKFGERFTHLATAFGLKPTVMKIPWGEAGKPEAIKAALAKNPKIKSVCAQLCETSTAALNDIKAFAEITQNSNAVLIVDAISALGADRLETDAWGVDVVIAGSQKALMLPPGLAFISVNDRARERIAKSNLPKFYVNLALYEKSMKDFDTPFTPALGLVRALDVAMQLILDEGLENVLKRSHELGEWARFKMQSLGMKLFAKAPSSTVSAAYVPENIDGAKLVKIMRDEKGVTIAGGQAELKGKIIRIAHMASITKKDLEEGFQVLEETMQELGAHV